MARPWVDYIARTSFLLQQGRDFADVAYFYGEEGPLTGLYERELVADAPVRYAYDFVNADGVLNRLEAEGQELVAKSGARYRALYLGGSSRRMTLPVLRRLAQLAEAGATIVGGGTARLTRSQGRRRGVQGSRATTMGRRQHDEDRHRQDHRQQ